MSIIYRTPGPWGPGTTTDLDPNQIDANFWQLVQDVAAKAAQGIGISNIVVNGDQMTVVLTDHTLLGPYTLPTVQLKFQGDWLPNHAYVVNDIFTHAGSTYIVTFNHTSAATFDPGATDGLGHNFYGLLLQNPACTLPAGGPTGYFLRKAAPGDYVTAWETAALTDLSGVHITAPTDGEILTYLHGVWTNSVIVAALHQLTDVNVSSPTTGQVLEWNGSFWVNATPITTLHGLTDVALSTLVAGQALVWSGGSPGYWINSTLAFALAQLSDVLLGTLLQNQPLIWSGTHWANANAADMVYQNLGNQSGAFNIDLRFSEFNKVAMVNNCAPTFTWPNSPNQFVRRAIEITNTGAFTLTWPLTFRWPGGGVAPTMTPYGTDVYVFYTPDGGTTVFGNTVGQNYLLAS